MPEIEAIAHIKSDFPTKFGIPRQSGLVDGLRATVVFEPKYRDPAALRGLDASSHIWRIGGFSQAGRQLWSPTVRPPRLGGNTGKGVFATPSPYRPNSLGISSVAIDGIQPHTTDGPLIHVLGADLMDGTPIYDIKPYIPFADSHPQATDGFAGRRGRALNVSMGRRWLDMLPPDIAAVIIKLLEQDPRPSYQSDGARMY